jgi:hypothetical protein
MKLKDNFQGKRSDENIFRAVDRKIFLKNIFRRTALFTVRRKYIVILHENKSLTDHHGKT